VQALTLWCSRKAGSEYPSSISGWRSAFPNRRSLVHYCGRGC